MDALDETTFQQWYKQQAAKTGINPNPDDPLHYYDFRGAYKAGKLPGADGHWSSKYKLQGHPRLFQNPDGSFSPWPAAETSLDTRTMKPAGPMTNQVFGYQIRYPQAGELATFKRMPDVTGMATEDGRITLNPNYQLNEKQRGLVAKNEAIRLFLMENEKAKYLNFPITDKQKSFFKDSPYGKPGKELNLRHTLIARILTGDDSAQDYTPEQKKVADDFLLELMLREKGKK